MSRPHWFPLQPTQLECAEQHAGHLVPTGSTLTHTLAASLACASRSAGSPPCAQLQQLTLAEADASSEAGSEAGSEADSGSEEEEGGGAVDQLLMEQAAAAGASMAGGGRAAQDSQAASEEQQAAESVEQQQEPEPLAAAEEPHTAEAAAAAEERQAGEQQQVAEPAAVAPGSRPVLTGSSGYNRAARPELSAPAKSFKTELAALKRQFKAEGISLNSPEFNDAAMDVLERYPQVGGLGRWHSTCSSTGGTCMPGQQHTRRASMRHGSAVTLRGTLSSCCARPAAPLPTDAGHAGCHIWRQHPQLRHSQRHGSPDSGSG